MKQPVASQNKTRRKFDNTFKRDAVALWLSSGKSAPQIAQELGIEQKHLYLWKKTHAPLSADSKADLQEELAALRHENAHLRQRCDILKKTLGILSEPPQNATNGSKR
jgi:transposase